MSPTFNVIGINLTLLPIFLKSMIVYYVYGEVFKFRTSKQKFFEILRLPEDVRFQRISALLDKTLFSSIIIGFWDIIS